MCTCENHLSVCLFGHKFAYPYLAMITTQRWLYLNLLAISYLFAGVLYGASNNVPNCGVLTSSIVARTLTVKRLNN